MQQIWMRRKGGPEVLEVREVPVPEPGPGEVRISTHAAGVNFADIMMRRGLYPDAPKLPAVAGYEVAGVVDKTGAGVAEDFCGRRVLAMCSFGGYSGSVCVPIDRIHELPAGVGMQSAAALPVNYLTAWQMVRVMTVLGAGDTVLVHSAAGGVGQAVIQLLQPLGVRLLGSASPGKHDYLRGLGVEAVCDSRQAKFAAWVRENTEGRGADVVLEPRNGRWIAESYAALAKCGRLMLFGFSDAARGGSSGVWTALATLARVPWLITNPLRLMNDNRMIGGVNLGRMGDQGVRVGGWMREILALAEAGSIAPVIDSVHPFSRAGDAHDRLELRRNVGKVLLVPEGKESG